MAPKEARFTERAAGKILDATRRTLSHGEGVGFPDFGSGGFLKVYEGELTADIAAPSNAKTGATTGTAVRWVPIPGSTTSPIQMQNGTDPNDTFKLTNRSVGLAGPSGTYAIWVRIGMEFRLIWLDC